MTRYEEYEQIIDLMDVENTTDVEYTELVDEMAWDEKLNRREYCDLVAKLEDKFGRPF